MAKDKAQKGTAQDRSKSILKYPEEILRPVSDYLREKLFGLEKQRKEISAGDPVKDRSRLVDNAAVDDDAAEQVGHMQATAFKLSLDRRIVQVRKALTRIKLGTYGTCERCGVMIDTDRLVVMPETTLCVNCERKREK